MATMGETTTPTDVEGTARVIDGTMQQQAVPRPQGKKFKSRNKDLPDDLTFDNTGPNKAANFQHALRGIADFLHTTYSVDVAGAI